MGEELTYLDLLVLRKIDSDSSVEKFGQQINTSFFETANVLGTMKIKGFVDIQSSIGGQSPLVVRNRFRHSGNCNAEGGRAHRLS